MKAQILAFGATAMTVATLVFAAPAAAQTPAPAADQAAAAAADSGLPACSAKVKDRCIQKAGRQGKASRK